MFILIKKIMHQLSLMMGLLVLFASLTQKSISKKLQTGVKLFVFHLAEMGHNERITAKRKRIFLL